MSYLIGKKACRNVSLFFVCAICVTIALHYRNKCIHLTKCTYYDIIYT